MIKKSFKISIPILFSLLIVLYVSVVITNNYIADKIEKELVAYNLPENTDFVDSLSVAGKLTGSGNGMQYMGAILVTSELSVEELKAYYSLGFDYIEVRKQENAKLDFIRPGNYNFNDYCEIVGESYYSITCWDSNRSEMFSDFVVGLLDFDIRGH